MRRRFSPFSRRDRPGGGRGRPGILAARRVSAGADVCHAGDRGGVYPRHGNRRTGNDIAKTGIVAREPKRTLPKITLSNAPGYLVSIGRGDAVETGAAGEIANVSHAFQPEGRFVPSNSP